MYNLTDAKATLPSETPQAEQLFKLDVLHWTVYAARHGAGA